MADYLPKFKPGTAITFTASADIIGGRAVAVTGNRTVAHAGAASTKYVGIAGHSAAQGEKVTVHLPGQVQRGLAASTIAAGDTVATAADGKVATGVAKIGLALTGGDADELVEFID